MSYTVIGHTNIPMLEVVAKKVKGNDFDFYLRVVGGKGRQDLVCLLRRFQMNDFTKRRIEELLQEKKPGTRVVWN